MNIENTDVRKSRIFKSKFSIFTIGEYRKHGFIKVGEIKSAISEKSAFSTWPILYRAKYVWYSNSCSTFIQSCSDQNHPAGYSSEYSAGRKFATGYSAGTILLPITQKIRHYGKNESYLTQSHIRGFQNIKLVFHYSKSVSRENSKCLHFPSAQMKHIVQNRTFIFSSQTE